MINIDLNNNIADIAANGNLEVLGSEIVYAIGAYYKLCEQHTNTPLTQEQLFQDLSQKILFAKEFFNAKSKFIKEQ